MEVNGAAPLGNRNGDGLMKKKSAVVRARVASSVSTLSDLQKARLSYIPRINPILAGAFRVEEGPSTASSDANCDVKSLFPNLYGQPTLHIVQHRGDEPVVVGRRLRLAVVLSGGPAPGGHNVVSGLLDYMKCRNADSVLFGFLGGPSGMVDGDFIELDEAAVAPFRNQGGFHIIGSGRTKIETKEQFDSVRRVVQALDLDGLVVVGGDDSNSNAMKIAEDFKAHCMKTCVVGCPKTIDNDLRNFQVETSFGFDTASKVYANLIANLGKDAVSAGKTYHFVRVMGRSASHIALECALQTRPNLAFIGEEVKAKGTTLTDVVRQIAELVCSRAQIGKNYGLIILPEGLVEFMPDVEKLITELNEILAKFPEGQAGYDQCMVQLTAASRTLFALLPQSFSSQLMLERDPHGNVQVAKIEVERLLIGMVERDLKVRKEAGEYKGKFNAVPHYMGYEARCALPTNFDANYCYGLGHVAAALIDDKRTGYIAAVSGLTQQPEKWVPAGYPLTMMMHLERRKGRDVPVIKKMLVDLDDTAFSIFKTQRDNWKLSDDYRGPGPIQFWGPDADQVTLTLASEDRTN